MDIFIHADIVNAQNWGVSPPKSSQATLILALFNKLLK